MSRAFGRMEAPVEPPKNLCKRGDPVNTTRSEELKAKIEGHLPETVRKPPDAPMEQFCPQWCRYLHRQHTLPFCQVFECSLNKSMTGFVFRCDRCLSGNIID